MIRIQLTFLVILFSLSAISQTVNDSIYKSWWTNKYNSIFQTINKGQFSGSTTGYIQLVDNIDTLLLDFQFTKTSLSIDKIKDPVYDDNTKIYLTQTTSGKTTFQYESFMMANVLTILFNGIHYGIGVFDGASDTPIPGLTFNYCHENNIEFLTLFVTIPLRLSTSAYLFNRGNSSYQEAEKNEKAITVLPGSTLIVIIKK
jgi:hypothetical protein